VTTVYEVAEDLRALGLTLLADPPGRTYTTVGEVAWDCEDGQLVAAIRAPATSRGLGSASPSPVVACIVVPLWEVCVELVRCVPTGEAPPPADLSASAQAVSADMEDLFFGFVTAAIGGSLLEEGCSLAALEATVVGPTGGMVGFRVCVRFELSRAAGAGS
jgi:hypothetical protein